MSQHRGPAALSRTNAPAGTFLSGTKVQVGDHRVVIERYLSEGGFAHVYVVRLPKPIDGVDTAVLKRVAVPDKDALTSMRIEVETMKKLKGHNHIVKYIDSHASSLKDGGYEVFLLMEYCNGGGLIDFMNTRLQNRLTEPEILKIFSDACQGLASMHYLRPPLLHRDLKVENILITGTGSNKQFKLCDFGSTAPPRPAATTVEEGRLIEEDIQKNTTMQYRSPEMIDVYRRQPIDEKSDIWALGVFLYKLCYYTTPFEEQGQMAILNASFRYPAYPQFSDRLKRLIAMMLQEQPSKRPNIYLVFKEVCSMRNRDCPLKDIYSGRTASEARRNQELPSPPKEEAPSGITRVAPPPERKLHVPEVTPMRRGRPANSSNTASHDPSPSPGPPIASDPFAALDGRQGTSAQAAAIDELSSKFPSLDQFSLLHDSGSKFAFDNQRVTSPKQMLSPSTATPESIQKQPQGTPQIQQRQQQLSQKVTEALADDAFVQRPKNGAPLISPKPVSKQTAAGHSHAATQTSFSPTTQSSGASRPKMISTGTMTSQSPTQPFNPGISSRPIFKIPNSDVRSITSPRPDEVLTSEPSSRTSLSMSRPPLLEHRSKSQTALADVTAATAAATLADDTEISRADESLHRARSTNTRNRPLSQSIETASRFLHGRSPSSSKSRPDRTSGILIDMTESPDPEAIQIESNVDFLRQMEGEDHSRRHSKRLSASGLANFKRSSITGSGSKSILGGRLGEAFKRFETNSDPQPTEMTSEQTEVPGGLTPIDGSETLDGRSDDGQVLEETQDLSPEMRRELERRRLSQEERRVAEAAAAYKQRVATNGTGREGASRATAIQNRVQALLDESAQKSPTRTAEGYGKYTNAIPANEDQPARQLPQRASAPLPVPAKTASAPAGSMSSDMVFPRPTAPPKPQILRPTGGVAGPTVARKPAKLAGTSTGQSLLQQRLAMDQANSQAGHSALQQPVQVSATGPAAAAAVVGRPENATDDDWESSFSKRYPSLGNLEMEEMKI